jgi:hypothetical protein
MTLMKIIAFHMIDIYAYLQKAMKHCTKFQVYTISLTEEEEALTIFCDRKTGLEKGYVIKLI